uniref:Ig-like domain-containing protein n=1 Tax=Leptobrachium leishanense TaxID=445787 RepID=A0A8C5WLH3_9ANUR
NPHPLLRRSKMLLLSLEVLLCSSVQPKSVNVTERDPVTLECTVAGTPELLVRWLKDGRQIMPSRYYTLSFEDNISRLRIQSVSKEDSGEYTFKVENDFGFSSCTAYVTVLAIPPSFTKKLTNMAKVIGSSIQMDCKVSGSQPINAQWFKDGNEILHSAKHKLVCHENTVSLTIANLDLSDNGNYKCKVVNVAGSAECSSILTVKGLAGFHLFTMLFLFKSKSPGTKMTVKLKPVTSSPCHLLITYQFLR